MISGTCLNSGLLEDLGSCRPFGIRHQLRPVSPRPLAIMSFGQNSFTVLSPELTWKPIEGPTWRIVVLKGALSTSMLIWRSVEARKLEHDRPPIPNQRKEANQHKSSYIHVPTSLETTVSFMYSILLYYTYTTSYFQFFAVYSTSSLLASCN